MSTLTLSGLRHGYDGEPAVLDGIDLEIHDGEMVAVVGPSGTGKSTLLRCAAGLLAPQAGAVSIDGTDVTRMPTERRDLTVMFQRPHLFDHLDVAGNVAFGPRRQGASRREARQRAERYLGLVELAEQTSRRPGALSGGQQQRVALARALACERGVLLLDEPFSSLDPRLRSQMHGLLAQVRVELSPTILMVTHDLDEASLADRVAVLAHGRLEQVAPAPDLYARPASRAVASLVGGFHEVAGRVEGGAHVSAYGRVRLDPACSLAEGEATLLLRRESLRLVPASELGAHSGDHDAYVRRGQVAGVRLSGPRQIVTVGCPVDGGASERVEVELKPDRSAAFGDEVAVRLAPGARGWAVSARPT